MELAREYVENFVVLKCDQVMDINTLRDLSESLEGCLERGETNVVLDLFDTRFLDSIIAGKILGSLKTFRERHGDIKLLSPQMNVLQSLKTLGVLEIIEVYQNLSEIGESFARQEAEKLELEHIKKEVVKHILKKYDRLCTDLTIEDRLQAALDGKYVPNIERDLNIVDLFDRKSGPVLFADLEEFCRNVRKYFISRNLSREHLAAMDREFEMLHQLYQGVVNRQVRSAEIYEAFGMDPHEAIDEKLEQLRRMIEDQKN